MSGVLTRAKMPPSKHGNDDDAATEDEPFVEVRWRNCAAQPQPHQELSREPYIRVSPSGRAEPYACRPFPQRHSQLMTFLSRVQYVPKKKRKLEVLKKISHQRKMPSLAEIQVRLQPCLLLVLATIHVPPQTRCPSSVAESVCS